VVDAIPGDVNQERLRARLCLCVSQSVTQSVTRNELNALQVAIFNRSSPNLPSR